MAARDLISDPEHWTQNHMARNGKNRSIEATDPDAVKFCALGAVDKTLGEEYLTKHVSVRQYLNKAAKELYRCLPTDVNDDLDHEAVMNMYDEAIKMAKDVE